MRRILVGILLALVLAVMPVVPAFALETQEVEITAIPTVIALTNSVDAWPIGSVRENKANTYWWTTDGNAPDPEPFQADDMKSTITNTGSVAEDIDVEATDFTGGGGWALTDVGVGENTVMLKVGKTGTANEAGMLLLVDATPQELSHELAKDATFKWCMHLETGTFTDFVEKTSIVTLTAAEHVP